MILKFLVELFFRHMPQTASDALNETLVGIESVSD